MIADDIVGPNNPFVTGGLTAEPPLKIAITGRFRTGKDTVADMILDKIGREHTMRLAFADALKRELSDMVFSHTQPPGHLRFNTEGRFSLKQSYDRHEEQMRADRAINGAGWQWWGEYRRQKYGDDYWVNHPQLQFLYDEAIGLEMPIIITDMRHHNEAAWCRERGFYLVRVEGPCRSAENRDPNHPSEIHVDELPVDWIVENNRDIDHLRMQVDVVLGEARRGMAGVAVYRK